jgi:hypothetical protein
MILLRMGARNSDRRKSGRSAKGPSTALSLPEGELGRPANAVVSSIEH